MERNTSEGLGLQIPSYFLKRDVYLQVCQNVQFSKCAHKTAAFFCATGGSALLQAQL